VGWGQVDHENREDSEDSGSEDTEGSEDIEDSEDSEDSDGECNPHTYEVKDSLAHTFHEVSPVSSIFSIRNNSVNVVIEKAFPPIFDKDSQSANFAF